MKFRKKPIEVDAWQITKAIAEGMQTPGYMPGSEILPYGDFVLIKTLEGNMRGNIGDWIIQGINGELYPCKDDIFKKTYEPIN